MKRVLNILPFLAFGLVVLCGTLFFCLARATVKTTVGTVFSIAQIDTIQIPGSSFDCVESGFTAHCTRLIKDNVLELKFSFPSNDNIDGYGTCTATFAGHQIRCEPAPSYTFTSRNNRIPRVMLDGMPKILTGSLATQYRFLQMPESMWTNGSKLFSISFAITFALVLLQLLKWGEAAAYPHTQAGVLIISTVAGFASFAVANWISLVTLLIIGIID